MSHIPGIVLTIRFFWCITRLWTRTFLLLGFLDSVPGPRTPSHQPPQTLPLGWLQSKAPGTSTGTKCLVSWVILMFLADSPDDPMRLSEAQKTLRPQSSSCISSGEGLVMGDGVRHTDLRVTPGDIHILVLGYTMWLLA